MELQFNSVETIANLNASAAFQVDSGKVFKDDVDICPVIIDKKLSYIPWGGDNNLPYHILDLIESDETLSTCQQFNAEVCYGSGLRYNVDGVCHDFKHFAFCVSGIILNAEGNKVVRLIRKEACYCRLSPAEKDGGIKYLLYANWRNVIASRDDIEVIDLLDVNSPWRDLAIRMGKIQDGAHRRRRRQEEDTHHGEEVCRADTCPDTRQHLLPHTLLRFAVPREMVQHQAAHRDGEGGEAQEHRPNKIPD